MNDKKVFFQDFLLEDMPVNEQEYPDVQIKTCGEISETSSNLKISLDKLLRMNKKTEWDSLFAKVKDKNILINDDVCITNHEVDCYKEFYLGVYYYNLSKHCKECRVTRNI